MYDLPIVLAVDDEPANLLLYQRLLQHQFKVICSPNGPVALSLLEQAPVDVVLLDIMMPGMTGFEVLEHIRANPATTDIPVILVSALADAGDVTRGLQLGANDYISKPIDPDIAAARVQTQVALKQLQDQRKKAFQELQAAQELKDRLMRIASHDLKGPLMNGRMISTLLRRGGLNADSTTEWLDALDSSLDTMQTVIEDFLDTSAASAGQLHLKMDRVALRPVVDSLVKLYQPHAAKKDIHLAVESLEGEVHADAARFQQALGNLVSNAIKYSPFHSRIHLWAVPGEGKVAICVADEGPGIPEAERPRLFTQFGKLSARPTDGEHSTGMGLWIVKHLINLQGGDVGVDCPLAGGSVFWIEMNAA
jgi:signal transduction histidine kinase